LAVESDDSFQATIAEHDRNYNEWLLGLNGSLGTVQRTNKSERKRFKKAQEAKIEKTMRVQVSTGSQKEFIDHDAISQAVPESFKDTYDRLWGSHSRGKIDKKEAVRELQGLIDNLNMSIMERQKGDHRNISVIDNTTGKAVGPGTTLVGKHESLSKDERTGVGAMFDAVLQASFGKTTTTISSTDSNSSDEEE
jgi:hypothetical protein